MSLLKCHLTDVRGTSKAHTSQSLGEISTFGFRGEGVIYSIYLNKSFLDFDYVALASAADVSCLEICSRSAQSRDTWSIILKVCSCYVNRQSTH
jgi:DNA mismatch repair protein MLH3